MRIGIIGYICKSGLGIMVREMRQHLGIEHQLIIPNSEYPMVMEWGIGQWVNPQWEVDFDTLNAFLCDNSLDAVVMIETPFGERTIRYCNQIGVPVILIPMLEFFNPNMIDYQGAALYVCVTIKTFQEVPFDNKIYCPWPVDDQAIPFKLRKGKAKTFVHNVGHGGMNGRKGSSETLVAFLKADVNAKLIINSQIPVELPPALTFHKGMSRVEIRHRNYENVADLYQEGDVLIYPSKYDGHALVTEEAMCAGMPVITTDAAPMNEFIGPGNLLLVKVRERKLAPGVVNPHCEMNLVDIDDLAEKMVWCTEHDLEPISQQNRIIIEQEFSWRVLWPRWKNLIGSTVSGWRKQASGSANA